jgi:hypothetical protein
MWAKDHSEQSRPSGHQETSDIGIGVEGQKVYSEQGRVRPLIGPEASEMRTGIVGQTVHYSDQGRQAFN